MEYNGMIDFNGWIEISMNIDPDLDSMDDGDLKHFFTEMEPHIMEFNNYSNQFMDYRALNGNKNYFLSGSHNHVLSYFDDLIALYQLIGKMAPGSFGLLYVRLPEDPIYWNQYRVFRLAKGVLTEHEDRLLSPCQLTIE